MKLRRHSQWRFGLVLGIGALVALVLCIQCVRTYLYTGAVLVPQQAEHEAARQAGALTAAARSAEISNPLALAPLMERAMESASDRVLSMRVLDRNGRVLAQRGNPPRSVSIPPQGRNRTDNNQRLGTIVATPEGQILVVALPLRISRPPGPSEASQLGDGRNAHTAASQVAEDAPHSRESTADDRRGPYLLELAISLKAVAGTFEGLRQNLIVGLIASIALLISVAVIGLRAPHYFRGKYLENELQLARRVQSDLQPKPDSVAAVVDFAASCIAADHVGGDFYDIFEAEPGKIAIVLGDVSGKGIPAALLVSVLQGAIRSSTAFAHEMALERINRMLCERTACEKFATLFWGIFDPASRTLRYVNAGHGAPILSRGQRQVERLDEAGPVLGLFPDAHYSAGTVTIGELDRLVVYSDGITEAASEKDEEFGEARVVRIMLDGPDGEPERMCQRIMTEVISFADEKTPQDDCTLMVINFRPAQAAVQDRQCEHINVAVA